MCTVCWHQKRVLRAREKKVRSFDLKQLKRLELKWMSSCNSETAWIERRDVYVTPDDADDVERERERKRERERVCVCVCVCVCVWIVLR